MSDIKASKELQISSSKLESMQPSQLEMFAEEKSKFILEKIELSTKKITDSKKIAEEAKNMKGGIFGKTRQKADKTAEAVLKTNEAVAEMNELLQESIRFTCLSLNFAQAMSKHMSALIVNGFKNRDGEFIKLSSDSEEQARYVVKQAEVFAKNQLEVEKKQAVQDSKIDSLGYKVANNMNRLNEKDKLDAEQSEKIQRIFGTLNEKDRIDEEQTQRLEELGTLLSNKNLVDQKQEEAINVLFEYTKQKDILDRRQSEEIERIKKNISKKLCIVAVSVSMIALFFSVFSIVFQFIK